MNFLAHLHLSTGTAASMLGSVVADFLRPPQVAALPADVQDGVRLHRAIDAFTDRHSVVRRGVRRIADHFGWFAGIALDIYFDHVLARGWSRYSAEPLAAFAGRCYDALAGGLPYLPDEAGGFIRRFVADDRLVKYGTTQGIADTLARVSDRIERRMPKNAVRLEAGMPVLLDHDAALAADFHEFYPQLAAHVTARPG